MKGEEEAIGRGENGRGGEEEREEGEQQERNKKRKRRPSSSSRVALSRSEQETEARHRAIAPLLQRAHLACLQHWPQQWTLPQALASQEEEKEEEVAVVDLLAWGQTMSSMLRFASVEEEEEEGEEEAKERVMTMEEALKEDPSLAFGRRVLSTVTKGSEEAEEEEEEETVISLLGGRFVLPPCSAFLMADVRQVSNAEDGPNQDKGKKRQKKQKKENNEREEEAEHDHNLLGRRQLQQLRAVTGSNDGYRLVVMDPPWENKSVRRSQKYPTLPPHEIAALPIPQLASSHGCLVVVWVTNKISFQNFIKKTLFRKWNATYLATWYWLKVTMSGDLVIPLASVHRKPYEPFIIGYIPPEQKEGKHVAAPSLPENFVVCSVADKDARKPPLQELLKPYIGNASEVSRRDPFCLELFARNLNRNCTSWGNQALMFQQVGKFLKQVNNSK
ncbi:Methyltransferase-like protein 4 [Balamuthia mandrillaris]